MIDGKINRQPGVRETLNQIRRIESIRKGMTIRVVEIINLPYDILRQTPRHSNKTVMEGKVKSVNLENGTVTLDLGKGIEFNFDEFKSKYSIYDIRYSSDGGPFDVDFEFPTKAI